MIYKILGKDVYNVSISGAQFIIFSADGKYALVKSSTPIETALNTYLEIDLPELYNDPLYKQPCKDC